MEEPEEKPFAESGVRILRPEAPAAAPEPSYLCWLAPSSGERALSDEDAETLAVLQELAFLYAMEQARNAVRAVMLRVNKKCYSNVHAFLQRHMQRVSLQRERGAAVPRVVPFPSLMKLPVAAVVSGSDATFSDVWMTPLCQVVHRSFPVILVVRDDMEDVRRLTEWVLERLDDYAGMKKREEAWLIEQIETRSAIAERHKKGADSSIESVYSALRNDARRRLRDRPGRPASANQAPRPVLQEESDDEYTFFDVSDNSSDDDYEDQLRAARQPAQKKNGVKRKRVSKSGLRRREKYNELLLEDLLSKLRRRMKILRRKCDSTLTWIATLREVIQEDLNDRLSKCGDDIQRSIICYAETIEWVKSRIVLYRNLRPLPLSVRAATAEYSLAAFMCRIMTDFADYLDACKPATPVEVDAVFKWKQRAANELSRHQDAYHLYQFDATEYHQVVEQLDPFLLLCIENLDRFKLQVLRDFVDLLGHFASSRPEQGHFTRVGFIIGISSTTSQTLRQLGLSVMRRLDIQFFPLEDSKTRSEDIFESLFVDNHFPLWMSGDLVRLLDDRHLTSQSLAAFMQVLEYIALNHFQDTPWSFLSRYAFEIHHQKPIPSLINASSTIRQWIQRTNYRARSLRDTLSHFSDHGQHSLFAYFKIPSSSRDRVARLESEFAQSRVRRAKWIVGWKCFRAACAWFDVENEHENFVECLSAALDGHATRLKKAQRVGIMIRTKPIERIVDLLRDWSAVASSAFVATFQSDVEDLFTIAEYILSTPNDPETVKMAPLFREELARFFSDHVLSLLCGGVSKTSGTQAFVSKCVVVARTSDDTDVVLNLHEDTLASLASLDDEDYNESSFAGDLSLAFMYYREHSTLYLNLSEWFEAFADAIDEEVATGNGETNSEVNDNALNARFARALAALRLWGYIKGPDGVRGNGTNVDDTVVVKQIFT